MSDFQELFPNLHPDTLLAIGRSLLAVIVAVLLHKLSRRVFTRLAERGYLHDQLCSILVSSIKWLLVIVLLLVTLGFFGVSVASLWTTLSAMLVLIAIGFVAMWSVLSNVLCSILLVIFAPFRIGDEIEVQDAGADIKVGGQVTGLNMMHTTIRTLSDSASGHEGEEIVRIPNNFFFQKYVRCWPGRRTSSIRSYLADRHQQAVEAEKGDQA